MNTDAELGALTIVYDGQFENGYLMVTGEGHFINATSAEEFVQDVKKERAGHCNLVELIGYLAKKVIL